MENPSNGPVAKLPTLPTDENLAVASQNLSNRKPIGTPIDYSLIFLNWSPDSAQIIPNKN